MAFLDKAGLIDLWDHILAKLGSKVDKIPGKQLSTNDYTDEDKAKLDELKELNVQNGVGEGSLVIGDSAEAYGTGAVAEGGSTTASGSYSHAAGYNTNAQGDYSSTHGQGTLVKKSHGFAIGKYNKDDDTGTHAFMIGNGTGTATNARSNAHTVKWDGTGWFQGDVYVGGTSDADEAAKKLATEEYVDSKIHKVRSETVIVSADAWTGTRAPYFAMNQACSIATMTNNLIVGPSPTLANDEDGLSEILSADTYNTIAQANLMAIIQADGSLTFAAYGKKPEIDIPVIVMEVG